MAIFNSKHKVRETTDDFEELTIDLNQGKIEKRGKAKNV